LRQVARERGYSAESVDSFCIWSRRFILFHGKRHPRELGLTEIGRLLEALARTEIRSGHLPPLAMP
jgi:hypothetical protein